MPAPPVAASKPAPAVAGPATETRMGVNGAPATFFKNAGDCPSVTYVGKVQVHAHGTHWNPGQSASYWCAEEAAAIEGPTFKVEWPSGNPLAASPTPVAIQAPAQPGPAAL